jgi:hypothetical protein
MPQLRGFDKNNTPLSISRVPNLFCIGKRLERPHMAGELVSNKLSLQQ